MARILSILPEIFRNWGGCRLPGSYAYVSDKAASFLQCFLIYI